MISGNERQEVARRLRGPECKHKWKYQIMNDEKRNDVSNKLMDAAKCISKDDVACVLNDALHGEKKLSGINENCSTCCSVSLTELADLVKPSCDREALQWLDDQGGLDAVQARLMPEGMEWPRFEGGELARIGDEVKTFNHGQSSHITSIFFDSSGAHIGYRWNGKDDYTTISPSMLKRPQVFDADGAEIKRGDTVWHVKTGREYVVVEPSYGDTVVVRLAKYDDAEGEQYAPDQLTHERPDSWERIEEDAGKNPFDYCKAVGHRLDTCENSEAYKARDLVRRAKLLYLGRINESMA